MPKAELHVHVEGTMEPSQMLFFAERNNIKIPKNLLNKGNQKYLFSDYRSFIHAYINATLVLTKEIDFYELCYAYLKKAVKQGVLHAEIFFDLQTYLPRKIDPGVIINGLHNALIDAKKHLGMTGELIMCFIRHLDQTDAFRALKALEPYKEKVIGVGLAAYETGNSPEKFKEVFKAAHQQGYRAVAHAGEMSVDYILDTIQMLGVERIDHGFACVNDVNVMNRLKELQMPLTVCPFSNLVLGYFDLLSQHPLKKMYDAGLSVSINSDDPAFFGGYIADNYLGCAEALNFSCAEFVAIAQNSFKASFLEREQVYQYLDKLHQAWLVHGTKC
jgi:adenosine deaminase